MSPHLRKFIGAVLLLVTLIAYALAVMIAASAVLPGANKLVEAMFYAFAGLAWVLPAAYIVHWMHRDPRRGS